MVSWNDVSRWDAGAVAGAGDGLVRARTAIVGLQDEIEDAATPEKWTGPSADAARDELRDRRQDLEELVAEVAAVVTAVDSVESAVRQLRRDVDETEALAAKYRFGIEDGKVVDRAAGDPADRLLRTMVRDELDERIAAVLRTAGEVDDELAGIMADVLAGRITDGGATTLADAAEAGGERVELGRILAEYQVSPDPDGTVTYPPIIGVTVTKSEAELLDDIGLAGMKDMYDIRDNAFGTAEERFPGQDSNDSHQDAFRHAYWNALMTQRFGADWTERYGTAHERLPGNPADREAMDLYNNEVGRKIATEHPDASPDELADLVAQAVRDGKMVVIDGNGELAYSDDVAGGETGRADDPAPERPGGEPDSDAGSTGSGNESGDYDSGSGPAGS